MATKDRKKTPSKAKAPKKPARKTAKKSQKTQSKRQPAGNKAKAEPPEPESNGVKPVGQAPSQAQLVSLAEVASMLRMHPIQVRKLVQTGKIPGVKVEGEWRFNKDLVYQVFHERSRGF
jgi:excisionase family DNA binding protein